MNDFDKYSSIFWKLKPKLKSFMETQAQILPKTQFFGKSVVSYDAQKVAKKSLF